MAQWKEVSSREFAQHLRTARAQHKVRMAYLSGTLRLHYVNAHDHHAPTAEWIAKEETIAGQHYYSIAPWTV